MADVTEAGANTSDLPGDNGDDGSITINFTFAFNASKCAIWWCLWLLAMAYALARRRISSRAWFIYGMLLAVICFNAIQTSAYVGYASHVLKGHKGLVGYLVYLLFFNASRSAFLAVLMVVASGYCITRSDLGPHKQHVFFVPTTVLVTGLITDFSFFALQSSPDQDTYDLSTMGTLAAAMWFVCSVLNLSALILAWLYIFEALGKETNTLEEEYQRRTGKLQEEELAAEAAAAATAAAAGQLRYAALAHGAPSAAPVGPHNGAPADLEPGDDGGETVADHLAYTAKKKLLSRFSMGVAAYLISDICVLLLPAFFNHVVQSTLQVLLFVCYLAFIIILLVLFRPQEQSSYLMIGFSEEDAEKRGVNQLLTGIAMGDLHQRDSSGDDEISRLESGPAASAGLPLAAPTMGAAAVSSAAPSRSSIRAAARTVKKADRHPERYGQIPAGSSPSAADNDGAGPLMVSSHTRSQAGAVDAGGFGGLLPAPSRGRQARVYTYQHAAPTSGEQFTLGDDENEADDSSRLLSGKRERGHEAGP